MTKKQLEIHSENILPIIKKWLYSDRDVFVRELVSNACDALYKLKILSDQSEASFQEDELKIEIFLDKEKKTLTFTDTGIGMTAEEVQKYIAQIAFSGAEDFMEKYKSASENDQMIGHFGLGFYSAYMVADKVEIDTLSYKPGSVPVRWICDGSNEYILEEGQRKTRGTEITLFVNPDHEEFLETAKIQKILKQYCEFLPYPVFFNGERINPKEPLWVKPASECKEEDYKDFYAHLYPMEPEPLFWIHLNVDYPFHLKGVLYFPKIGRDFDPNQSTVKLFCNRVFVSDHCKEIIPNYLMALKGVIDSPDIPLNVSRSYLQMDKTVRLLASHISKKVSDSLSTLYKTDKERFITCYDDLAIVIKMGILEDEKFYERAKEFLIWKNDRGEWTTIEDYLERNKEKTKGRIYYAAVDRQGDSHISHFIEIYRQKGIEVLFMNSMIDPYIVDNIERKLKDTHFKRVDAEMDEALLDKEREKNILNSDGRSESAHIADFIKAKLNDEKIEVEAKSLSLDSVPAVVVIDEHQRRLRDHMARLSKGGNAPEFDVFDKKKLVVNTNNRLISAIRKIDHQNPELAKELVKETYELALLSQRELMPENLNAFIARSTSLLAELAEQAVKN